jgi:aldehyde dehydrogenase (NAD+)
MAFSFGRSNLPKHLFINNEYVDSKSSKKYLFSVFCFETSTNHIQTLSFQSKDGSLIADDVAIADATTLKPQLQLLRNHSQPGVPFLQISVEI